MFLACGPSTHALRCDSVKVSALTLPTLLPSGGVFRTRGAFSEDSVTLPEVSSVPAEHASFLPFGQPAAGASFAAKLSSPTARHPRHFRASAHGLTWWLPVSLELAVSVLQPRSSARPLWLLQVLRVSAQTRVSVCPFLQNAMESRGGAVWPGHFGEKKPEGH